MAARLKVYATRIGFHDVVVAAPNQKAALAAWDVRENLFATGAAVTSEDPAAVEAALAHPGVVLSRPIGGGGFTVEAQTPPAPPTSKKSSKPAPTPKPSKTRVPPPDRTALDAAERALRALEAEEQQVRDDMGRERKALEAREAGLQRALSTRRRKLEQARDQARTRYENAGGR